MSVYIYTYIYIYIYIYMYIYTRTHPVAHSRAPAADRAGLGQASLRIQDVSEGGIIRLETLIELTLINSSCLSCSSY